MANIEIRPVRTESEKRIFLTFPWKIFKDDPFWVPPLLPERQKAIDPEHSAFLKRGVAEFFIAWRNGEPVGTICAAEDPPTNAMRGKKECVFGFFDYIEDQDVFRALIECASDWGRTRGLQELYGPWNLDYEDSYGVLVEGRDRPPALMCGHTPEYYPPFMDNYGFEKARPQNVALGAEIAETPQIQRMARVAERIRKKGWITIRNADFNRPEDEIDNLYELLNTALAHLEDHIGWQRESVAAMVEPFMQIADPELILFADVRGETVGFLPGLPDLNEIFTHVNGLRTPWNYLQLLWRMKTQKIHNLTIKSVLVLPEYWNTGVGILLFDELVKRAMAKGYTWTDLSITSIDNPNTIILAEHMGAEIYKRWQIYRLDI
ncbi:MAG: GNAT family N-acetyltransferase [Anaerolineales bacterium]|nr:GNAT family N-acetyltransferase [Anaerolineales bacterium]